MQDITPVWFIYAKIPKKKFKECPIFKFYEEFELELTDEGKHFIFLYAWTDSKEFKTLFLKQRNEAYFKAIKKDAIIEDLMELYTKYSDISLEQRRVEDMSQLNIFGDGEQIIGTTKEFNYATSEFHEEFVLECFDLNLPPASDFNDEIREALEDLMYPFQTIDDYIDNLWGCSPTDQMVFDELMIFIVSFGFMLRDDIYFTLWMIRKERERVNG